MLEINENISCKIVIYFCALPFCLNLWNLIGFLGYGDSMIAMLKVRPCA